MSKRTVILIVLDGWGIGPKDASNAIYAADPKNINQLKANFPSGALQASGIAVGLPWGEEGNSEVGHLNMGAGKVIYQNYPKITLAIRDGSFFENKILKETFEHAKKNDSAVNLIGLLTEANVHASLEHLEALIKFSQDENAPKINLHLITDGRDSPPQSALDLLKRIPFSEKVKLASIAGRYYAMDRDKLWDRTQKYYSTITGEGILIDNLENHFNQTYQKGLNDEYILPILFGTEKNFIKDNDAILFFNFREDRMRQLVETFINKKFAQFPVKNFSNLHITALTEYDKNFKMPVAFPPETIDNPIGKILADNGKNQLRIAETEKYAHITYFFNGERESPFENEYRVLIPSIAEVRHDAHPEMRAKEIADRVITAMEEESYDFILVNLANADMVAHTGNYEATISAIKAVDEQINRISKTALEQNDILIITSDHGNAERLFNPKTGEPETKHDPNPVPVYLVANEFKRERSLREIEDAESAPIGLLSDIAPTILELMKISKPKEMTGQSLVKFLISNY
ncbi:MAG: 2,3-bisphosphoglycerate-independent phosphoglycerate mutase [Patescibacteria group bacterium]